MYRWLHVEHPRTTLRIIASTILHGLIALFAVCILGFDAIRTSAAHMPATHIAFWVLVAITNASMVGTRALWGLPGPSRQRRVARWMVILTIGFATLGGVMMGDGRMDGLGIAAILWALLTGYHAGWRYVSAANIEALSEVIGIQINVAATDLARRSSLGDIQDVLTCVQQSSKTIDATTVSMDDFGEVVVRARHWERMGGTKHRLRDELSMLHALRESLGAHESSRRAEVDV